MRGGQILGREQELAALEAVVAAGHEQGSALLVVGDPGIGKSTLLAMARRTASEAGYTVLRATGTDAEMHLPFGALHQALMPVMHHASGLPESQRNALATALGLAGGPQPDLFLIAEAALAVLTGERAERPVIIVVDDVQWLDPQSHQILAFLAHRGIGAGFSVVGAIRSGHLGPFADAGFPRLHLGGLDNATAEHLLRTDAGPLGEPELRRILEDAQGNPLALLELPRSWLQAPPTGVTPTALSARLEQAFAGRISELPQASRDALLVAATGSSSDIDELIAALSAFGVSEPSPAVFEPAVDAGLIIGAQPDVTFRHPLVRSAVLQQEPLARRHAAHAALADALLTDTYRRSWHRACSIVGPDDEVADALAATVPDSLRRGAVMSAVSSLERAAQLTSSSATRGQRLMQAAEQAFAAGRADVVARILRDAAQVDLTDLDEIRLTWLTEALNDDVRADSALVRKLCDSARRAEALDDTPLALNLLLGAALRCWWADSGFDDQSEVLRVLDQLKQARDDPRHLAALAIAEPVLRASEVTQGLSAVNLAEVVDGNTLRVYALAAYGVGDFVVATDLLDRAEASFRAAGRLGMLPVVLALQLQIRLHLGDWSGAAAASREVVTISRETGQALFAENNILVEARGLALRGEWQAALENIADAEAESARLRINDRICLGYQARGAGLLSADRPAEAFACLSRQFDPADPGYHLRESFAGLALTAEAAAACGRLAEARAITAALETVAVVTPSPLLRVNLLYAQAVLAQDEARDRAYEHALSQDLTRWPWIRARLLLSYGRWLAPTGRCSEAATYLRESRDAFERIGAARWSRHATSALEAIRGSEQDRPGSSAQ